MILGDFFENVVSAGSTFCREQRMVLNVKKTKEMIVDSRVKKTTNRCINLYDLEVGRVSSFKLLGISLDDNLKWNSNTDYIVKKQESGCTFLRSLKGMERQRRISYNFIVA